MGVGSELGTHHQCGTLDLHESGKVLDFVGGGQLAACSDAEREEALVHDGVEVSAGGIDGSCVASRSRAAQVSMRSSPQCEPHAWDLLSVLAYPMMTSFECILRESTLESPATGVVRVLCEAAAATGSENKDTVRGVARRKIEANSLAACAAVAKVGCGTAIHEKRRVCDFGRFLRAVCTLLAMLELRGSCAT